MWMALAGITAAALGEEGRGTTKTWPSASVFSHRASFRGSQGPKTKFSSPASKNCPLNRWRTSSQISYSQGQSWLAITRVVPHCCLARSAASFISCALAASTLAVGSSINNTSGFNTRRAASATRCVSPPDSSYHRRFTNLSLSSPTRSRARKIRSLSWESFPLRRSP